MLVLVANVCSSSFKYKLLDMEAEGVEVARGAYERIGQEGSPYRTQADVIEAVVRELKQKPDVIGFRAVHGGPISGAVQVNEDVLNTMERFADLAPAQNPACVAAMKAMKKKLPGVPQIAVFETAFHQTIPPSRQTYAVPFEWTEKLGIRRYGFHGASHRYVAMRVASLLGKEARRIISCRLDGSCSVCAIENGKSVACSFGMTLQSGLPHTRRTGDLDAFALLRLSRQGYSMEDVFGKLAAEAGLLGMSGVSADVREIERAAGTGNPRAKLAIEVFVEAVRQYIGAYLVVLGGCDALIFTGTMGENSSSLREAICRNLEWTGIELDGQKNLARGKETKISKVESNAEIWIIPANEELIVAQQAVAAMMVN